MKKNTIINILLGIIITSFITLSISAFSFAWFSGFGGQTKSNVNGDIGLRGYFHSGNGDIDNPYVITRPSHLYNLARLQNRGVYPEKRYFQIGVVDAEHTTPVCIDDNGNYVPYLDMTSYCSTRTLPPIGSEGTPFCSKIDGNGIPIVGLKVEGNPEDIGVFGYVDSRGIVDNMIFKNLEVKSTGYSDGTTSDQDYSDELFSREIDDLFNVGSTTTFGKASMEWVGTLSTDESTIAAATTNLKNTSGFPMNNINATSNLVKDEEENPTTRVIGYFRKHDPDLNEGDIFKYDWHSSSTLTKKAIINGEEVMVIDLADISTGEFNSGGRMKCNSRISLTASTVYDGIEYSRVIQSYDIEFYSNATFYSEGKYSLVVYCDYVDPDPAPGSNPTNYHHGNNIGLVAGHVDGSITDCYVYNGSMILNSSSNNTHISCESETGLVGEIGTNVHTPINPEFGKTEYGETGVMNFSGIYKTIRRDFQKGDNIEIRRAFPLVATLNGSKTGINYSSGNEISAVVYDVAKTEDGKFGRFSEYLRHGYNSTEGYVSYAGSATANASFAVDNTETHIFSETTIADCTVSVDSDTFISQTNDTSGGTFTFNYDETNSTWVLGKNDVSLATYGITLTGGTPVNNDKVIVDLYFKTNASSLNSVDFLWNNVIQDEYDEDGKKILDRGLGVFKIATQYKEAYKWMYEHDIDPIESGCYLDGIGSSRIINGDKRRKVYYSTSECDWRKEDTLGTDGWNDITPLSASTIPSYSTVDSFGYPFSRDFNYCFEMDLSEPNKPVGKNYFFNVKGFLLNYFESILIDEDNTRLTPDDERFGFLMCDSDGNQVDSISAYMEVGNPGAFCDYVDGDVTKKYPSNSIVFKIDNETGANISVIGSDADISVYRNWKNDSTGKPVDAPDLEELFTMRSRKNNDTDTARYFPYTLHATTDDNPNADPVSNGTGLIEPQEGNMAAGSALYAHTFKLDKGEYVIGSSKKLSQGTAKIYYLAVQGQDDANLGRVSEVYIGKGVEDVDFLLADPLPDTPPVSPLEYVKGETTRGGVALVKAELSFEGNFNTQTGGIQIKKKDDETCLQILFNDGYNPTNTCTTALLVYCRKLSPRYYLNSTAYTKTLQSWPIVSP